MSTALDAIKELLRQQFAAEAERDAKLRQREGLDVEIAALDADIAKRAALVDRLGAQLAGAGAGEPSTVSDPQPKRPPDPLSCRIIDYVNRNSPARHADLCGLVQAWTGRGELWARQKLSNLSEDKGLKARASRKRPYLLSSWVEGQKLYELGPYGRANLRLVEHTMVVLQKSSQKMTH